jgi:hypothetical protein
MDGLYGRNDPGLALYGLAQSGLIEPYAKIIERPAKGQRDMWIHAGSMKILICRTPAGSPL